MPEYINREAFKKEYLCFGYIPEMKETEFDEFPAADVAPVRHGRWENGICTNCKFDIRVLTDGENYLEQWVYDEGFEYCPNCGAKMDGEGGEKE